MKHVIFSICCFLSLPLFSQPFQVDSITGKGYYEKVITTKGTKDQLYTQAKAWVFNTFKNGNSVIQDNDKDAGRIYGEAVTHDLIYNNTGFKGKGGYFKYSITILVKEGKTKIRLDNITYHAIDMGSDGADIAESYPSNWHTFSKKFYQKNWDSMKEQAYPDFEIIMKSYELAMYEAAKKDEW